MTDTGIPPLYDEAKGLRELARHRLKRDQVTRAQVIIADRLAEHMQRHFSAEDIELAGRALLVGAASCAQLAQDELPAATVVNILGFAAGRMIADGRAWLGAQGGDTTVSDPYAREIGRVEDSQGREVRVGVNYDTVTLRTGGTVELDSAKVEELAQLLVSATWQAAWQTAVSLRQAAGGAT